MVIFFQECCLVSSCDYMSFHNLRSTLYNIGAIPLLALRWNIVNQNDPGGISLSSEDKHKRKSN